MLINFVILCLLTSAIWHLAFEGFATVLKSSAILCTIEIFCLFCNFGICHLAFGIWGVYHSAQNFCYFVYYRNILFILQFWHLPFCIWGVYHSAKKFYCFVYNRNILFILAFVICHLVFQWFYFAFYLIRSTYSNCEFWFNFLLGCIFSNYIMSFFIF